MDTTPISLLQRARTSEGDPTWDRLVELYTPFIRRWLGQSRIEGPDADDLCQDVLTAIVRELPAFEHSGRRGAFRKWLRSIVFHRILGYWRSQNGSAAKRMDPHLLQQFADPAGDLGRQWDDEHDRFVVRRLLALLEPEFTATTWQAFCRQSLEGLPPADVAAQLGITPNAVAIAKSRVLRRLREEAQGLID